MSDLMSSYSMPIGQLMSSLGMTFPVHLFALRQSAPVWWPKRILSESPGGQFEISSE
jgi:hypothetical protein